MNLNSFPRRQVAASWLAWVLALTAGLAACATDEPNPTGTPLPADVSQDTLLAPVDIVGTVEERIVPLPRSGNDVEPYDEREILYYGRLQQEAWEAAPLVQYDFSDIPDTISYTPDNITRVEIELAMLDLDSERNLTFDVAVYQLNAPLSDSMLDQPLANILGPLMCQVDNVISGSTVFIDMLEGQDPGTSLQVRTTVAEWLTNRAHDGVALVDVTDDSDSTLVGFASSNFSLARHSDLLGDQVAASVEPLFIVDFANPSGEENGARSTPKLDMSHFTRPAPVEVISLDSYLATRVWLNFGLSNIPRAATINFAELVLNAVPSAYTITGVPGDEVFSPVDSIRSFTSGTEAPSIINALVYEAYGTEDLAGDLIQFERVLNAAGSFNSEEVLKGTLPGDKELRINISDYVQRVVNGIFEDDPQGTPGLLIVGTSPYLQLSSANVLGSISAVDSLRPRMEIRFTPPADYVP